MKNKLVLVLIAAISLSSGALAIDRKYMKGYDILPASINTASKERCISFFKDNTVIFLKPDPKGKSQKPVVFKSTIKENGDLGKPKLDKALSALDITGTVAFDEKNNKIYFHQYSKIEKDYILVEATAKGSKWSDPVQMRIEGTGGLRGENSFMVSAGWSYKTVGLAGFTNPCLAKDGKRIYFTAKIKGKEYGCIGGTDIWYIDQKEDGSWGKPTNLGLNVNTTNKEDFAFCVGDTTLYFTGMGSGGMDLFKTTQVNGEWTRATRLDLPFSSNVNDYNLIGNKDNMYLISTRVPKGKDDIYIFKKIPDPKPTPPDVVIPPPPAPVPIKNEIDTWNFVLFYFDFDKHVLTEEFTIQFDELVSEMRRFPDATFEIAGHTDQKGSDKYNDKLSISRAEFVKKLLIAKGFPATNLIVKGFGEKMPVVDNPQTEEEFASNRRCELRMLSKEEIEALKNPNAKPAAAPAEATEKDVEAPVEAPKTK